MRLERGWCGQGGVVGASLLLLVVALAAALQAASPPEAPDAVVRRLYSDHFAHAQNWEATLKRRGTCFAPELLAQLNEDRRAAAANPEEVAGLDFDPLTNAQESASAYEVAGATRDGANAVVVVTLRFGRDPIKLAVRLVPAGSTWQIANITYPEGDLVRVLRELRKARSAR